MLVFDFGVIGNKLYEIRKKKGMSRAEVSERANLSDRTYADIERGSVNMRVDTLLKICGAMGITPDEILVKNEEKAFSRDELLAMIDKCSQSERETVLRLLSVYFDSLNRS